MAFRTLICTTCWIIQIVRWIVSWALKEPYTSGRHSEDDYIEIDHRTVIKMARLEDIVNGEMAALKDENSKLKSENIRLQTNRLEDSHASNFSDNNTAMTTKSKLSKYNVLEEVKRFEGNIQYFSDELTALKTQNPKLTLTIANTDMFICVKGMNERMDLFYDYGSTVTKELKDFTEKYDALEERINKMEDTYYEGIKRICDAVIDKADLLDGIYERLNCKANYLKDCMKTLREKTNILGINYGTLKDQVDLKMFNVSPSTRTEQYDYDEFEVEENVYAFDEEVYEFDEAS